MQSYKDDINIKFKNNFKIRNYSTSTFNKNLFEDFWIDIIPISNWYSIEENGHSYEYEKNHKNISGIYIYRRKSDHLKCYIGSATCLSSRFMTHRWQVNSLAKGGYSSTPLFHKAVLKHKWLGFEIAILKKGLKTE